MLFHPIASSSAGCSYIVSPDGENASILIDCGVSYSEIRKALNFQVSKLDGVLISHAHGDHAKCWRALTMSGVNLYAHEETWATLKAQARQQDFDYNRCHSVTDRDRFKVGNCWVHTFSAVHDMPGTLGFVVTTPSKERLLYLTDSMYSPVTFEGLTHIAIECNHSRAIVKERAMAGELNRDRFKRVASTHMSLEELLKFLDAQDCTKVEEIYLLHLSDENSDAEGFKNAVIEATGIPTKIAAKNGGWE